VFIWILLHCATAPLPSLYVKVAQRAARSSYTLYLMHFPFLIFLVAAFHLPRQVPSWHWLAVSMGFLLGILLYAQLIYQLFERNTDRIRQWIKPYVFRKKTT
jgi:peptidoglycan/LPS O-acetylase OafA/YrhL